MERRVQAVAWAVAGSLMLSAVPAQGQECVKAQEVVSPCGGVLLPTSWAKDGIQCLRATLPWCQAEVEKVSAQKQQVTEALIRASERHWYDSTVLWAGVGFVAGALTGVALALR